MPRKRANGALERSAAADLFRHTLSRIPTVYGRLAYLASLRDPNSGVYRHHGLNQAFGRDASVEALQAGHADTFVQWLNLPLSAKAEQLTAYLTELEDPREIVIRHWIQSEAYRGLIPDHASPAQVDLFLSELKALLEIWERS